jgi:acyl-CoA reductase-like NAD-dependent aldehyde dehydrogenase
VTAYDPQHLDLPLRYALRIGGRDRPALSGAVFDRRSPADGRLVGTYADAAPADAAAAVDIARAEFDHGSWRDLGVEQKAEIFRSAAALAAERAGLLAEVACWEVGKPFAQAQGEVRQLIAALEFCADAVAGVHDEDTTESDLGVGIVVHEPVGVVLAMPSYNFPINLVAAKVPYALAAGCSVIVKTHEISSGTAYEVCRLLTDAGVPAGALQVISSTSIETARALVRSPLIDKIAFTGSTPTGQAIIRDSADTIKRLTLELGGKGPLVVFDDADLDLVEGAIFTSIFQMAGQVCTAGSRLIVQDSVHDAVLERVLRVARTQRIGHPLDPATTMGPVSSEAQLARIAQHVEWAAADGGVLVHGGERLTGGDLDGGWYYAPTVFDHVDPASRLGQQEVFGPVLAVSSFATENEAVEIANGTDFGLKAMVFTDDDARLRRMLRALRAGMVYGNTAVATVPQVGMPFGGYKRSGIGREYGHQGLIESFMETKAVFIRR